MLHSVPTHCPRVLNVQALPSVPADIKTLAEVEVQYEELPGWQQDISEARSWDDLPANAQSYVRWCPARHCQLLLLSHVGRVCSLSVQLAASGDTWHVLIACH